MTRRFRVVVDESEAGDRLDRFLAERLDELSRSRIQQMIDAGDVRVDGEPADKASRSVQTGERITLTVEPRPTRPPLEAEDIPLRILYEDDVLAAIDKPADLVVHPAPGHPDGTLVNALLHRFEGRLSGVTDASRPGIVHRLDKGTTGVIVVALDDRAHRHLARQFATRTVDKEYLAVVYGAPEEDSGVIDVPLGRDRHDRKKISAATNAPRDAITRWEVMERFPSTSLVRARPRTGRTHQIRAHLAWLHHPLVGDDTYAGRRWRGITEPRVRKAIRELGRPALHARRLGLEHPGTGERLRFEAPLPGDLSALLELLRAWRDGAL